MKKNNKLIILTTVICLLPLILSLIMYNDLPPQVAIHFDAQGNPDNYAHKAFAAFGLPIIMALINAFGLFILNSDPKSNNSSAALKLIGIWTVPILSVILTPITLFIGIGVDIPIKIIIPALVGILFIICGNYLPKCKQNYTVGIKLPWTLSDEDNWNKTHHLAGYLWIIGGILVTISAFINKPIFIYIMLTIFAIIVIVPAIYSYTLYKKKRA